MSHFKETPAEFHYCKCGKPFLWKLGKTQCDTCLKEGK
jgi:hypothetical protein